MVPSNLPGARKARQLRVNSRGESALVVRTRDLGGPRWIQTRGPVYAPHAPGNTGEFAREKSRRENCRLSLYAFALHRPLRYLKSGLGIEAEMMRKAPLRS
jgi:hypothetical protein